MAEWNYENAAHLLRRVTFGGTPQHINKFLRKHSSVESAVDELLNFRPSKLKPPTNGKNRTEQLLRMQAWWLSRMINSNSVRQACHEKLTFFWHTHLVSAQDKQPDLKNMSIQNRLFRFMARGNFRALIRAFNRDPANMYYLDGITNIASSDGINVTANENLSRELLELFLEGPFEQANDGTDDPSKRNYSEADVRHFARILTGWNEIVRDVGVWIQENWDGGQYDDDGDGEPDDVTLFGVTNNNFRIDDAVAGTPDDVLELIFSQTDGSALNRNRIGLFISRELWTFYAYAPPAPPPSGFASFKDLMNHFSEIFVANDFELTPLLRAIWTHDEFYSERAKLRTVANPVDYIVSALRSLGIRSNGKTIGKSGPQLGQRARDMGMNLFAATNVSGWPGGLAWMSTGTLLNRLDFARDLAATTKGPSILNLKKIPGLIHRNNAAVDPGAVVDLILAQFGLNATQVDDIPVSSPRALTNTQRQALIDYVTDGDPSATLDLSTDKTYDAKVKVRGLIALVLQTAEIQVF